MADPQSLRWPAAANPAIAAAQRNSGFGSDHGASRPIKAIGEQLDNGSNIIATPELFDAYEVFAAELAQIFTQPWLAVDHASRLAADGDYVRADIGSRSVVLVRESADQIHALRNACLHAGYRVCEAEAGNATHLYCVYHGWSYALDGRLTDPMLQPK